MFEAKFANASLFKKIIEVIGDFVTDAPFDCTEDSLCLQAVDQSHVSLASLKLGIGFFEVYRCDRTISIGQNLSQLNKILKCLEAEDTLMIHYQDGEKDCVTYTFEDNRGRKLDITLKLMDIDAEHLGIPDTKYPAIVEMPSSEFQKICRAIASFSDTMNITATKSGFTFSGSGDSFTITINKTVDEDDEDKNINNRVDFKVKEKVSQNFSIKYLTNFTKATSLSNRVRLCICDRVPLMVEYDIEGNGYLRYYLAAMLDE